MRSDSRPIAASPQTFAKAVFDVYLNAQPLRLVDWWWTDYGAVFGAFCLLCDREGLQEAVGA